MFTKNDENDDISGEGMTNRTASAATKSYRAARARNRNWEKMLEDWDHQAWMEDHGEWASSAYAELAEARAEARASMADVLKWAASAAATGTVNWGEIEYYKEEYLAAEAAMQSCPEGDADYIKAGIIDPDRVSQLQNEILWQRCWEGWDCEEGERILRVRDAAGSAIVHNWWRDSCGGQRRERDLWRVLWREEAEETEAETEEAEEADEAEAEE